MKTMDYKVRTQFKAKTLPSFMTRQDHLLFFPGPGLEPVRVTNDVELDDFTANYAAITGQPLAPVVGVNPSMPVGGSNPQQGVYPPPGYVNPQLSASGPIGANYLAQPSQQTQQDMLSMFNLFRTMVPGFGNVGLAGLPVLNPQG